MGGVCASGGTAEKLNDQRDEAGDGVDQEAEMKAQHIEKGVNTDIDSWMTDKQIENTRFKKLLLLGAGSSGKSTLFKQLKCIYKEEGFEDSEYTESRHVIRRNCVTGMITLLKKAQELYEINPEEHTGACIPELGPSADNTDPKTVQFLEDIQLLILYSKETFEGINDIDFGSCQSAASVEEKEDVQPSYVTEIINSVFKRDPDGKSLGAALNNPPMLNWALMRGLGSALSRLWTKPEILYTFDCRGVQKYSFPENMDYFYCKAEVLFKRSYVPSIEDVLKSRIRTTGIVQETYQMDDKPNIFFNIIDVGGQRNERKKWIHQFDNVTAVIFVAALNHYCAVLFEDEKVNGMVESLNLFDEICNIKWFRKTEIIVFLNKDDLFRDRLSEGHPLSICFTLEDSDEPWGWKGELYEGPNMNDPIDARPDHFMTIQTKDKPAARIELREGDDDMWFLFCYESALAFIQKQYLMKNKYPRDKSIYVHVTTATNPDNIKKVFWDVQNIVVRSNLKKSGLV